MSFTFIFCHLLLVKLYLSSVLTHAHTILKSGKLDMNHKIYRKKKQKQKNRIVKTKIHNTLFMKNFGRHSSAFSCLLSISHPGSTFPSFLSFHPQFCQSYFMPMHFFFSALSPSATLVLPFCRNPFLFFPVVLIEVCTSLNQTDATWKGDRMKERERKARERERERDRAKEGEHTREMTHQQLI